MRIASFNVENLFDRPRVMNLPTWTEGRRVLQAYGRLSDLFQQATYSDDDKAEMIRQLVELDLVVSDVGQFVTLRIIRGTLLRRPRSGPIEIVAAGRADWVGWVELVTEQVDAAAIEHTAMVLRDVAADVVGVVEAEDRRTLGLFSSTVLPRVGGIPYEQVMLVDGNDTRGIDVGLLTRGEYRLVGIRTHVFDRDADGAIFSRDCCEYHLRTPRGNRMVVLLNHFKSKGFGTPAANDARRRRQAVRVAEIYQGLIGDGARYVAVVGDLNDHPASDPLAPLLSDTDLTDISTHPNFDFGGRLGTFGSGNAAAKIDYVLLSPALQRKAIGGAMFRMGVWHGSRTKDPWPIYPTMTDESHGASDHAAIYADIRL